MAELDHVKWEGSIFTDHSAITIIFLCATDVLKCSSWSHGTLELACAPVYVERWATLTGRGDDSLDEVVDENDEGPQSDGDILGDVKGSNKQRHPKSCTKWHYTL